MEKLFLPYELALDLKELGFDEPCLAFYDKELKLIIKGIAKLRYFPKLYAPTFSEAFRLFREKYDLHSLIESYNQDENGNDIEYIYSYRIVTNKIFPKEMNVFLNSYEEAELECLKKLIEIVKNNK